MLNWEYIAGFIDGEGSFSIASSSKKRVLYRAVLSVANNDRAILEQIREAFGFGKVYRHTRRNPRSREGWVFHATGNALLRGVLPILVPSLHVKRRQAECMLEFVERRLVERTRPMTEADIELVRRMQTLNDRAPGKGQPIKPLPKIVRMP
jgi:hypothetical protein